MTPTSPHTSRPLLRVEDVAERCNVSVRTVRGWLADGKLERIRLSRRAVRVRPEALERFLSERASQPWLD